jgi:hypothetical protein
MDEGFLYNIQVDLLFREDDKLRWFLGKLVVIKFIKRFFLKKKGKMRLFI